MQQEQKITNPYTTAMHLRDCYMHRRDPGGSGDREWRMSNKLGTLHWLARWRARPVPCDSVPDVGLGVETVLQLLRAVCAWWDVQVDAAHIYAFVGNAIHGSAKLPMEVLCTMLQLVRGIELAFHVPDALVAAPQHMPLDWLDQAVEKSLEIPNMREQALALWERMQLRIGEGPGVPAQVLAQQRTAAALQRWRNRFSVSPANALNQLEKECVMLTAFCARVLTASDFDVAKRAVHFEAELQWSHYRSPVHPVLLNKRRAWWVCYRNQGTRASSLREALGLWLTLCPEHVDSRYTFTDVKCIVE